MRRKVQGAGRPKFTLERETLEDASQPLLLFVEFGIDGEVEVSDFEVCFFF